MAGLVCDIVTPVVKLYSGEAYMVVVPGVEGSMGFLQGHEPLVSVLDTGLARLQCSKESPEQVKFVVQGGYVQVTGEKVIILADRAVNVADIDAEAVQAELGAAEARAAELSAEELAKTTISSDIEWCKMRLNAVA